MKCEIPSGSVHVWSLSLRMQDRSPDDSCLDAEERRRAERFKFAADRQRFIRGRAAMRCVLGRYCGLDPTAVPLQRDANGKPFLPSAFRLGFNLSHSGDAALLAVGRDVEVGVDIEQIRALSDALELAERHFSTSEVARLQSLNPGAARDRLFLQCWTRKEAFAKSSGIGLSLDLRAFHVGFDATLVLEETSIRSWEAGPDFVAALAVKGAVQEVSGFPYDAMRMAPSACR